MKSAMEHQARLIFYPAINRASSSFIPSAKALFDLVEAQYVDGLLVWYAGIIEDIDMDSAGQFFDRYASLPVVTIGSQRKGSHDLSIDNYHGSRALIDHLVDVHGCRHIAIIRGPIGHPDADERYRGYADALQSQGLPINPDYIGQALFASNSGAAMSAAITRQWLRNAGRKPDAIVASSDNMALAAIRAIQDHGLHVPDDIAVVGFDDADISLSGIPSVTTIRQPFHEMGYQATRMLLALLGGQSLPEQSVVPAQLLVRESCGCTAKSMVLASLGSGAAHPKPGPGAFDSQQEAIAGGLASIAHHLAIPAEKIENLAKRLQSDLQSGTSHLFLTALKQYLMETPELHIDAMAWQDVISVLRRQILAKPNGEIGLLGETLFHQARVLITEAAHRAYIRHRLKTEHHIEDLHRTAESLITSFGQPLLIETLCRQLPELGFPGFCLSLYDIPEQPTVSSHLIMARHDNQDIDLPPGGLPFPTGQLIPAALPFSQQVTPLVVEPLYFREQQLGILVLEVGPIEGAIYENLRAQISSALRGSQLLQQAQSYTAQLERRVTERTEELTQAVNQLQTEVAERQQAQEALAQERNLLRTLVDSIPDIIYVKDAEGRFILKNETGAHVMGAASAGEVIGKTDFDYYPRELAERFHADDQQVIRSGQPLINREEPGIGPEGKERWILTTKVPLHDSQGKIIGLVGVGRDITERKQVEEELALHRDHLEDLVEQRTAELKAANEQLLVLSNMKDEFVSNVSHELRTPISSITLRHYLAKHHPDQLDEHLDAIKRETDRLARTIEDLLQLSRLDQRRTEFHPVPINLNELVRQYIADRMPIANSKQLTLNFQEEPEISLVLADMGLLGQMLSILLTNAINYTPVGGQVSVKTHTRQGTAKRWVGISISDTGPGIPPDEQSQLFARFFRGSAGRQSGVPGTGLGLAIAREIVKQHAGTMEVESDGVPGHGATFKVWLPSEGGREA
ncbi:MAG: substrate-binding domain-containing protein [Anaerolineae bacterium]|nr:substrate-binding domain-containing protein [Anaerolineae bacterium]